jgi:hypothetical protein
MSADVISVPGGIEPVCDMLPLHMLGSMHKQVLIACPPRTFVACHKGSASKELAWFSAWNRS